MARECGGQFVYDHTMWFHKKIWLKVCISKFRLSKFQGWRRQRGRCFAHFFLNLKRSCVLFWLASSRTLPFLTLFLLFICFSTLVHITGRLAQWEMGLIPPWPQGQGYNPQHVYFLHFIFSSLVFLFIFTLFIFNLVLFFTPI